MGIYLNYLGPTVFKRNLMTAWPPPSKTDTRVPIADKRSDKFVLNKIQSESATSSNIPILDLTNPINPAFVTKNINRKLIQVS